MKLTENLDAHISAYEQETGKGIKPEVVELIKAMAAAGDHFEAIGKKDACGGYDPWTKDDFIKWGKRELADSESKDNPIVDLMYDCYMEGYNAGRVQNEG